MKDKMPTLQQNQKSCIPTHKADPQIAHLLLPDTQAEPSQNQKSRFLPTHGQTTRHKKVT